MPRFFLCLILYSYTLGLAQNSPHIIIRNTKAPIEINGVIIKQDKKNVGYVRYLDPYNNGQPTRVYQVFLPNGTQIATAFAYGKNDHEWMVTLLNNPDITFDVISKAGADVKDIAAVLIKNGYL